MSHRPWEDSAPDPETPIPVTPTKPLGNAGAGHDSPDAENSELEYDSDEPRRKKRKPRTETKKRERHLITYVPIKRWPTGEGADMNLEEILFEVEEEARREMLLSGYKKAINTKVTVLDYGRRGKFTSRAASIIRFINVR